VSDRLLEQLAELLAEPIAERVAELLAERPAAGTVSPWLDVDGAAEYLSWPKGRVQKLTASRTLPHHRFGSRVSYHRDELDDFMAEHGLMISVILHDRRLLFDFERASREPDRALE